MKALVPIANNLAWFTGLCRLPYFLLKGLVGKPVPRPIPLSDQSFAELEKRVALYGKLAKPLQDADGFILTDKSDALLFSALLGCSENVNLKAARDASGAWFRRPVGKYPPSYPEHSKSTISRDMLLGVLWYCWRRQDLAMAMELWDYGIKHDWIMGEGDWGAIYFSPGMQATLAEIIYDLGGPNHLIYRAIPQVVSKNTGFRAHLDVMHILLRCEITKHVESLDVLEWQLRRQPQNPLFHAALNMMTDGDRQFAANLLLYLFPADRLPTDADWGEPYLFQRDSGADWLPEPEPKGITHPGADFIWLAQTLLR